MSNERVTSPREHQAPAQVTSKEELMATAPALGNGPVDYTDANGEQHSIPLSKLDFKDGAIEDSGWSDPGLLKLLTYLQRQSLLSPGPQAPAVPAMILQAATPGAAGNNVEVAVTKVSIDKKTFSMTVTETDVYKGLTPASIQTVIGGGGHPGTSPGLVIVSAQTAGNPMPAQSTVEHNLAGPDGSGDYVLDIPQKAAGVAFTVKATRPSVDAPNITVRIDNATASTFDLVAVWSKSADKLAPTDVVTQFGYELAVTAPPGGLLTPNVATIGLAGGSEPVGAVTAKATLIAAP
jgi:hypothetical protein